MLQVNSEFYTGWLDHWGDSHAKVDTQKLSRMLGEMLAMGANVNLYVLFNVYYSLMTALGLLGYTGKTRVHG